MQENTFDKIAVEYEKALPEHIRSHYLKKRTGFFGDLIKPGFKVLDIGCGTGTLISALARQEKILACGCDNSLGMLKVLKKDPFFEKVCADCQKLPFHPDAFDVVISVAVFHHLTKDELVRSALGEMIRVTKKGGTIIIWDANNLNPYWLFLFKRVSYDKDVESPVKLSTVVLEAKRNNIAGIRIIKSGWVPEFAPKNMMPFFRKAERIFEAMPGINLFSAHNIIILEK